MEAKAYAAEMSLRRAQEAAEIGRDEFATVSQRVLQEVDRFKWETAEDMRRTVLEYIRLQVEYNKKMEHIWATLIPQLERVQLDPNANVLGDAAARNHANNATNNTNAGQPPSTAPQHLSAAEPQIYSQPMVPNPQQAMQSPMANPFYGQTQSPAPQQDPGMLSVQYRESPGGAF